MLIDNNANRNDYVNINRSMLVFIQILAKHVMVPIITVLAKFKIIAQSVPNIMEIIKHTITMLLLLTALITTLNFKMILLTNTTVR